MSFCLFILLPGTQTDYAQPFTVLQQLPDTSNPGTLVSRKAGVGCDSIVYPQAIIPSWLLLELSS